MSSPGTSQFPTRVTVPTSQRVTGVFPTPSDGTTRPGMAHTAPIRDAARRTTKTSESLPVDQELLSHSFHSSFVEDLSPEGAPGTATPDTDAALRCLLRVLGVWNREVAEHGLRVSEYAVRLGEAVGLRRGDCDLLRRGALLHDVGKIAVATTLLSKPGRLSVDEFEVIKRHTVEGAYVIEPLAALEELLPFVRWHHERMDGRGYPDGRRGRELPLAVRIVAVADVFDALSSDRPYREALPWARCLEILRENAAGGGVDPELTTVFCRLVETTHCP
jgi:putative nucleotidyltransferase with HDIG domain